MKKACGSVASNKESPVIRFLCLLFFLSFEFADKRERETDATARARAHAAQFRTLHWLNSERLDLEE